MIREKVRKRKQIESKIYDNVRMVQSLETEQKRKAQIIMNFRNKMYLSMLQDLKTVNKVLKYAESASIKTIVQTHVNQFIYSVIHKTQICYHNIKRYGQPSCSTNCQFGELVRFLNSHKSQNMANKLKQIWVQMQKELHMEISQYIRKFGENVLNWETNSQQAKNKILQLNSQQMDMKVDLQILCCQLRNYFKLVGMEAVWDQLGLQAYQDKFCSLLQFSVWQINDYVGERGEQNRDIAHELAQVFYSYLDKMIFQFEKQTKVETIDQKSSSQIFDAILTIFKQAFKKSFSIMSSKREIEIKIIRLQQKYKIYEQHQFLEETLKSEQQLSKISTLSLLQSHRTISNKDEISISVRYNRKLMSFRVLKTMHISQSKKNKAFVGSRNVSQLGSQTSSRFNSISPNKKDKKVNGCSIWYPDNFCEQINEREIVFGKSKLILKKQNPHFHQEIELKRIICVKLIASNMLNICFKKGYMTLQFLKSDANLNQQCPSRVNSLGRQWIKCFRAVYYQQIHSINFIDEEDICAYNLSKQVTAKNKEQLKRKSVCMNKNKENVSENVFTGTLNHSESKIKRLNWKPYQNEDLNYPTISIRQTLTTKLMQ